MEAKINKINGEHFFIYECSNCGNTNKEDIADRIDLSEDIISICPKCNKKSVFKISSIIFEEVIKDNV